MTDAKTQSRREATGVRQNQLSVVSCQLTQNSKLKTQNSFFYWLLAIGYWLIFSTPVSSQLLRIGFQDEPKTMNYFKHSDVWSANVLGWFFESLYTREPVTHKVVPWIAEGPPEFSGKVATVKLKHGVTWEDGSPVTAHDVKMTADIIMDFKIPRFITDWELVEKVEAVDDYTVKFYLKVGCTPIFTESTLLSAIVPKKQWQPIVEKAKKEKEPLKALLESPVDKPLSAGSFTFTEWRKGAYLKITARKDYWAKGKLLGDKKTGPFYDGILFKFYKNPQAAILAMEKGELDYFWWDVEPGSIPKLKKISSISLIESPDNGFYYMAFNFRRKPYSDPAFRKAVATLVDREFIVKRILQGYGIPAYTVVPPGNEFWYNPDTPAYGKELPKEERIKKAKEILIAAGYRYDDKGMLRHPNGKPVETFDILTPAADYDALRAASGQQIEGWLKASGIPARSKPIYFGTLIKKIYSEWDFDAYILGWRLGIDPGYVRDFFHSSQAVKEGNNAMGYKNPEYDKIVDASQNECDREKRKELIFAAQEFVMKDVVYVPLYFRNKVEAYNNTTFAGWFKDLGGISGSILFLKPTGTAGPASGRSPVVWIIIILLVVLVVVFLRPKKAE